MSGSEMRRLLAVQAIRQRLLVVNFAELNGDDWHARRRAIHQTDHMLDRTASPRYIRGAP